MRLFRSTSLRLAAFYTAVFALAVVVLGAVTVVATRSALKRELDARIQSEALALAQEYRTEGLEGVIQAVNERDRTPGALDYGLVGPTGKNIAGRLAGSAAKTGWSTLRVSEGGGEDADEVRVLTIALGGGQHLLVGENLERIAILDGLVVRAFGLAFIGVILLGAGSGFALSREVNRRFGEMSGAAQAIIDGDLGRRIPVKGSGDDLDALAATLNRMLDRISSLMESLRQVSNDVAHDLRTPLTRLRQRLEVSLTDPPTERETTVEGALGDLDAILETFAALLRIAQIESGVRRAAFRPVALEDIAATVVEAFAPSAEEDRRSLSFEVRRPGTVDGDPELVTQMLVNLVENGLRHTPPGSSILVIVEEVAGTPCLIVRDNGPGVPIEERGRLFDRFVRLERSRSTPGSGLGLSLVAAIARLHDASVELADSEPGLEVTVRFAAQSA